MFLAGSEELMKSDIPLLIFSSILWVSTPGWSAAPDDFSHRVVPILKKHCVECHGGKEAKGGFSLNSRESFLDEGYAVPESAAESHFLNLIKSSDPETQMPPAKKNRLTQAEIDELQRWVDSGMAWDAGFSFAENVYEPPLRPRKVTLPAASAGRNHPLDRIIDQSLQVNAIAIPKLVDDSTFYRRTSLDLIGLLPTAQELAVFVADSSPEKREHLVTELLNRDIDYADHWLSFWNDLLRNDYTGTGFITGGRRQISGWLYEALLSNQPYDQFTRELLAPTSPASRGFIEGIKWRGEVSAGQTVEIQFSQSLSQAFLGVNMKCASCHDSFIDRWTLREAYGLAAIYSERELAIHRCDKPTGDVARAAWLFPELGDIDADAPQPERLRQLASLMTHPENGRWTRTIVNRLWAQLMGRGIVHPLDAMQTEPWNADLLDYLATFLAENNYDLKQVLHLIATSAAYQSETEVLTQQSLDGEYVYRGPRARRLSAEQFLDSVWQLTESAPFKFDAPVVRAKISPEEARSIVLKGQWIWRTPPLVLNRRPPTPEIAERMDATSTPESIDRSSQRAAELTRVELEETPAAGEIVMLRKVFELPAEVALGGAAITCDNEFTLFINNQEIVRSDDWAKVESIPLHHLLKHGMNEIVAIVKNGGSTPNAAGFYFESRMTLVDGSRLELNSDPSWEWNDRLPNPRSGRLGKIEGTWQQVKVVPELAAWKQGTELQIKFIVGRVSASELPMVRASLLNSDFLMRSLGRPLREQIVSSRPSELTTLEAIDLTNGETLAAALATGAEHLLRKKMDTNSLVDLLFMTALSRLPTQEEREVLLHELGETPTTQQVEDLLWTIMMLPEFMLIR